MIPGATAVIATLRARGIPFRFMTNTTIYCRYTLLDRIRSMGFALEIDELYSATFVAARYLREHAARSYYPLLLPDAQLEFSGIEIDEEAPEYVVVGDMGASFNFARLNRAFRALMNGAKLIALHKKRHWRTSDGIYLDAGPFVMALEYAAETNAVVVGKPSAAYFKMVLDDLNQPPERVAMVGDDIEIDVRGAKLMGMQGWLVRTGRFRKEDLGRGIWPDRVLESIADLLGEE
ncbi:MAG: TIGR01458 family HAD-type hydrolase [Anaerolineales bacterium]|nr:TIGR01458 family HAD-type hydrolase [Anaerolineales bacterium]